MAVSNIVGMDCAEALQGRGGKGDAGRATDVLHPLHLTNTPLEDTAERTQLEISVRYLHCFTFYCPFMRLRKITDKNLNLSVSLNMLCL